MKKIFSVAALVLTLMGCAMFNQSYNQGTEAALNKNWDEAVKYYQQALSQDPQNAVYRLALVRATVAATYAHLTEARKLAQLGKREEALAEYEKALSYDPLNRQIAEEATRFREGKPEEEKPKEVKIEPPIKLKVSDEKIQLRFNREASLRSVFQALGKHAGINIIFDEQFRDIPFSIDLTDTSFEQALNTLCLASKNFYRVIDEKTVIIVPDLPQNRAKYEINAIKTFYLSNINAQEIQAALTQVLRTLFKAPSLIIHKDLNAVTVRDTPEVLELAEKIIRLWDKPRAEVLIDLEIMEVSRIRLKELGLELDQLGTALRYSGVLESGWAPLNNINFSKAENFQVTVPTAFLDLLATDSDTKIIAQPRLRGIEGEKMMYTVADEIPIPQTTFVPVAAGGYAQQPIVNYQYKPVGIEVSITPTVHHEREVTLELDIKIKSLGGKGYADLPIISTRDVKNAIRLKDGETNLLAGLLKDEERTSLKGIAGLKSIPVLGRLFFSHTEQSVQQTDVILTITPYIIRTMPIGEEDRKPLWVDLEGVRAAALVRPERTLEEEYREMREERGRETPEAGRNEVFIAPANFEVPQGREFRVNVNLRCQEEVSSMSLNISFAPQVLELKEVIMGGFVRQFGENTPFLKNIDNSSGLCTLGFSSPEVGKGIKGTGGIAVLVFETVAEGESPVAITSVTAHSPTGQAVAFELREARVRVR